MTTLEIVFITDVHGASHHLETLIERTRGADALLFGGDLTNVGDAAAVRAVLAPIRVAYPLVLGVLGNMDRPEADVWLVEQGLSLHGRSAALHHWAVFGCGGANPTPFGTPNELSEAEITQVLRRGQATLPPGAPSVLVAHAPPLGTATDRVDSGAHVGSRAVRALLEAEGAPAVCLSGHIHGSVGTDRVGDAVVCNPGDFASGRYARVRIGPGVTDVECVLERL